MDADQEVNHRHWLQELDLAHFEATSPGMAYWLPRGMTVIRALREYFLREHLRNGYQEISTPQLADVSVYETSGHVPHYEESMFFATAGDRRFGIKPSNCPCSMLLFASRPHSYRELPLRWFCEDVLHRNELSGVLSGLFRVQSLRQDDTHIFVAPSQVEEEFGRVLEFARGLYRLFGLEFELRLGTAPRDHIGDDAEWRRSTELLRCIVDQIAPGGYEVVEGEGAFYAPKLDILMRDGQGRPWQTGTLQIDQFMPQRFGCAYVNERGAREAPVVIHRAIAGSFERFLGLLLEETRGWLPLFLAPVQVAVAPIAGRHVGAARSAASRLREVGFRVEVGDGSERLPAQIRAAAERRVPCVAVMGDREQASDTLAVRLGDEQREMGVEALIAELRRRLP
ncbi:MAG TPA: threonine--tRNA ligase [Candidatus Dormibacteraeota bacterium]|jgi:threonyl-tRNA synthetase|nr:threonine--tRNA ligase [Candidatus Dormibacteraeota bacterium]